MNRKKLVLLAVVGMVLFSGCLDMTMTVQVSGDGEIDEMEVEMEMDEMLYNMMESDAEEEGYDSVEEMLEDDMIEDADEEYYGSISTSVEELDDGDYLVTLTAEDVDPEGLDDVEVSVEDDTVYYEDSDALDEEDEADDSDVEFDDGDDMFDDEFSEFEDQISMEYVLVMPGEIQDTNAHEVSDDGTTATWDLIELENEDEETVYAESEIDDDGMPGFGVAAGLVAMLLGVVGFLARAS